MRDRAHEVLLKPYNLYAKNSFELCGAQPDHSAQAALIAGARNLANGNADAVADSCTCTLKRLGCPSLPKRFMA